MDVCKIRQGVSQSTAIDDCSRYKVFSVHSRVTGANTLDFLEQVIKKSRFRSSAFKPITGANSPPMPSTRSSAQRI